MTRQTRLAIMWIFGLTSLVATPALAQPPSAWLAHDMRRPRPVVVTPGELSLPVAAPSDAIVLFDGSDLSGWRDAEGGPAKWVIRDGYMESVPNSGYVYSAGAFGDVQLHVEWAAPVPAKGSGQGRGNSGVFLMSRYEVQVLDSYGNDTYPDGQAAAVYGQYPPLVNACLPPGEWQSYDVVFRRPRFRRDGTLAEAARMTVIHNGVLVQDNVELWGPTAWLQNMPYESHPDKLPLALQDHGNPVRFRNIWLRELSVDNSVPPPEENATVVHLSHSQLEPYCGRYGSFLGEFGTIDLADDVLRLHMATGQVIELVPRSTSEFGMRWTAGKLIFDVEEPDNVKGFTMHLGGGQYPIKRMPEGE